MFFTSESSFSFYTKLGALPPWKLMSMNCITVFVGGVPASRWRIAEARWIACEQLADYVHESYREGSGPF